MFENTKVNPFAGLLGESSEVKEMLEESKAKHFKLMQEHPDKMHMACVKTIHDTGPLALIGIDMEPVTIEAFKCTMDGQWLGTLPKDVVYAAIGMSEEMFNDLQGMFKSVKTDKVK